MVPRDYVEEVISSLFEDAVDPKISVVGVGGAGGKMVSTLYDRDIKGVETIAVNTDPSGLSKAECDVKILLGAPAEEDRIAGARAAAEGEGDRGAEQPRDPRRGAAAGDGPGGLGRGAGRLQRRRFHRPPLRRSTILPPTNAHPRGLRAISAARRGAALATSFFPWDGEADRRKLPSNEVDSSGSANLLGSRRNPGPMFTHNETIPLETHGRVQAIDITERVSKAIEESGVRNGLACVFTASSTSAIVTNEFEPGLMEEDIPKALDRLFPSSIGYGHERRWHDGNGHSHVRATFLGPSLTLPIIDGRPALGTSQQIVFLELDNKPRHREVVVQIVGDGPDRTLQ